MLFPLTEIITLRNHFFFFSSIFTKHSKNGNSKIKSMQTHRIVSNVVWLEDKVCVRGYGIVVPDWKGNREPSTSSPVEHHA